ncbi:MAG TPA: polysaccharide deacetylase family protein [Usitatibacter sp.]|jgi:peptidoglycan/xylan/chitin deacetylase (PgdA/CDA1 family)|nr:polysaccharide deacetylase family protein [Usitatibacter sp.]
MKIPILTYHSLDIAAGGYANNDLVAFDSDLATITRMGFEVMPLSRLVDAWLSAPQTLRSRRLIALTCDDGSDFDYRDLPHPVVGRQRSMLNILRDFREGHPGSQPELALTSFVIVSPEARATLDVTCLIGQHWWNDDWWASAVASGLVEIANHSWDHNHESLPQEDFPGIARGTFSNISTEELADYEIAAAQARLASEAPNAGLALFAYPYGEANAFLTDSYLPRRGEELGIRAAFTDRRGFLEERSNQWALPRLVFRRDWADPPGLRRILEQAIE